MYTSYSTLQRKQLTKQVYTDTQSTYLLVYVLHAGDLGEDLKRIKYRKT